MMKYLSLSLQLSRFLLTTLAATGLAASALAANQSEVVYSTDFESPAFTSGHEFTPASAGGWVGNNDGSSLIVKITDTEKHGGKQCLMESDQSTNATPVAWIRFGGKTLTNADVSVAVKLAAPETSFRLDFAAGNATTFQVGHSYRGDLGGAGFWVQKGSTVVKGVADTESHYKGTDWNKITCKFNKAENTFSLSINDQVILSLPKEEKTDIDWTADRLCLATGYVAGAGPNLTAYFDDLVVTTTPQ